MTITKLAQSYSIEIPDAGHCPQETTPEALLTAIHRFLHDTEPFRYDEARWRELVTRERQTVRTVTRARSSRVRAVASQFH